MSQSKWNYGLILLLALLLTCLFYSEIYLFLQYPDTNRITFSSIVSEYLFTQFQLFILSTFFMLWLGIFILLALFYRGLCLWEDHLFCISLHHNELHTTKRYHKSILKLIARLRQEQQDLLKENETIHRYISHEQKNELAILKAMIPDQQTELHASIQRLQNSIDDVLTMADTKENEVAVDIIELCAKICDQYTVLYPQIHFVCEEEDACYVMAKPRWLYRALANLLDNAIKYGNEQSIEVEVKLQQAQIQISVIDHGIGMEESELDRILQHGYRIDEHRQDGYGIGLHLVERVADLCNGIFWIDSTPKSGTCASLILPVTFQ